MPACVPAVFPSKEFSVRPKVFSEVILELATCVKDGSASKSRINFFVAMRLVFR